MLDSHLIATARPLARSENIVLWHKYRVSVLQDRLFRIERSENLQFRDAATQSVWFRDMPPVPFETEEKYGALRIKTARCTLVLNENRKDCYVLLNGKIVKIDNRGNLLGTYRTLDECNGAYHVNAENKPDKKVDLGIGVCSKTGVASFDDANSLSLGADGMVKSERGDGSDEYVFVYGNQYREAVKALYLITGSVPLVPRFALGNWWSRYHVYTDKEYLTLLNRFEEAEIPLTVATIDMDWHYSDDAEIDRLFGVQSVGRKGEAYGTQYRCDWTGYSWNKRLFPDHERFLETIKSKNLKITLNLHPADGIRFWEDCYSEMATAMGINPESKYCVNFDMADDRFINNYFSIVHRPMEAQGVDFWWIDWQQGTNSKLEGLDPLWALNHYHFLDQCDSHSAPLILSRYCGIGAHRYPLGFSGDTEISWETLAYLPYFTSTASNIGYTWWSHDIGGHHRGIMQPELYVRHVQFGVFSPINRLHCCNTPFMTKEPWCYGNGTGKIAADFLRLRHSLIPYLFSADYQTHKDGLALVEPLYYEYPDIPEAYAYKNEYFFGRQLLVVSATQKANADGYTRFKAWLPEGKWTDIFTGDQYEIPVGGATKLLLRDLESIPVLARAGAILPLSRDKGNGTDNPKTLEVHVFTGDGNYSLYENGALNNENGEFFTDFTISDFGDRFVLKISSRGDESVIPISRKLLVRFPEIANGTISLTVNGVPMPVDDPLAGCAAVDLDFKAKTEYEVVVRYEKKTKQQLVMARALNVFMRIADENAKKNTVWTALHKTSSIEEWKKIVEDSDLKSAAKLRLLETIS